MVSPLIVIVCVILLVSGIGAGAFYFRKGGETPPISLSKVTEDQISKKDFEEINSMYKSRLRVLRKEVDTAVEQMQHKDDLLIRLRRDRELCESLIADTSAVTSRVTEWETCAESAFQDILRLSGAPLQSPEYSEEYNDAIHTHNMRMRAASDLGVKERRLVVSEVYANTNEMLEEMLANKDLRGRAKLSASSDKLRLAVGKFKDCAHELDLGERDIRALIGRHRSELVARGLEAPTCEGMLPPSQSSTIRVEDVRRFSDCVLRMVMRNIFPNNLQGNGDVGAMMKHLDNVISTEQSTKRASVARANTINDRIVSTLSDQYDAVQGNRNMSKSIEMDIARQRERSSQMRDRIAQTEERAREKADIEERKKRSMSSLTKRSSDIREGVRDAESALSRNRTLRDQIRESTDLRFTADEVQAELDSRREMRGLRKNLLDEFDSEVDTLKEKRVTFSDDKQLASTLDTALREDEQRLKTVLEDLKDSKTKGSNPAKKPDSEYAKENHQIEEHERKLQKLETEIELRNSQRPPSIPVTKRRVAPRPVPNAMYDLAEISTAHLPSLTELVDFVMKFFEQSPVDPVTDDTFEAFVERFDRAPFVLQSHLKKSRRHPKDVPIFMMCYHIAENRVRFTLDVANGLADNVLPIATLHVRAGEAPSKRLRNTFAGKTHEISASAKGWKNRSFESNVITAIRGFAEKDLAGEIARVNGSLVPPSASVVSGGGIEERLLIPLIRRYLLRRVVPIYSVKWLRFVYHKRNWHRRDRHVMDYSATVLITIVLMGLRMETLAFVFLLDSLISTGIFVMTKKRDSLLIPYFVLPDLFIGLNGPFV